MVVGDINQGGNSMQAHSVTVKAALPAPDGVKDIHVTAQGNTGWWRPNLVTIEHRTTSTEGGPKGWISEITVHSANVLRNGAAGSRNVRISYLVDSNGAIYGQGVNGKSAPRATIVPSWVIFLLGRDIENIIENGI